MSDICAQTSVRFTSYVVITGLLLLCFTDTNTAHRNPFMYRHWLLSVLRSESIFVLCSYLVQYKSQSYITASSLWGQYLTSLKYGEN